jgi:hypothetical protein
MKKCAFQGKKRRGLSRQCRHLGCGGRRQQVLASLLSLWPCCWMGDSEDAAVAFELSLSTVPAG